MQDVVLQMSKLAFSLQQRLQSYVQQSQLRARLPTPLQNLYTNPAPNSHPTNAMLLLAAQSSLARSESGVR